MSGMTPQYHIFSMFLTTFAMRFLFPYGNPCLIHCPYFPFSPRLDCAILYSINQPLAAHLLRLYLRCETSLSTPYTPIIPIFPIRQCLDASHIHFLTILMVVGIMLRPLLGSYFDLSWEPNMVCVQGAFVYIVRLSPGVSL